MPDISAFTAMYPGIQLELAFSNENFNLHKREADVAIRITDNPPDYLIGRRVLQPSKGVYASRDYLKNKNPLLYPDKMQWVGWEEHDGQQSWQKASQFSTSPIMHVADDIIAQLEAVKNGMGIAMLPCFIADPVQNLERLEIMSMKESCGSLWILTHEDLRATARVRAFIDFMLEAFNQHRDLLQGRCYIPKPSIVSSVAL
jgi:DNA-binding transcriptional LysR family regulator